MVIWRLQPSLAKASAAAVRLGSRESKVPLSLLETLIEFTTLKGIRFSIDIRQRLNNPANPFFKLGRH